MNQVSDFSGNNRKLLMRANICTSPYSVTYNEKENSLGRNVNTKGSLNSLAYPPFSEESIHVPLPWKSTPTKLHQKISLPLGSSQCSPKDNITHTIKH